MPAATPQSTSPTPAAAAAGFDQTTLEAAEDAAFALLDSKVPGKSNDPELRALAREYSRIRLETPDGQKLSDHPAYAALKGRLDAARAQVVSAGGTHQIKPTEPAAVSDYAAKSISSLLSAKTFSPAILTSAQRLGFGVAASTEQGIGVTLIIVR